MTKLPTFLWLLCLLLAVLLPASADACPYCHERPLIWAGIFNADFFPYLLRIAVAVPLLLAVGPVIAFLQAKRKGGDPLCRGAFISAGVTIGIGVGGFLDGTVLHMLLQWHNLIAERLPPEDFVTLEINMFWDGIFNLGMLVVTLSGVGRLWKAGRIAEGEWSGTVLAGALLTGWGMFQIIDGVLYHWVFELHHIKQGSPNLLFWDLAYLIMGIALVGFGRRLIRGKGTGTAEKTPSSPG